MADWNALFRSEEFRAYRKKQIQAVARNIKTDMRQMTAFGDFDKAVLKGKMEMIKLFLNLPENLTEDDKLKELLTIQKDEDISNITKYLIRKSLND